MSIPTWDDPEFNWDDPRLTYDGKIINPWTEVTEPEDIWQEVIN